MGHHTFSHQSFTLQNQKAQLANFLTSNDEEAQKY